MYPEILTVNSCDIPPKTYFLNYHKVSDFLQRYFADHVVHTTHLNHLHHFRHMALRLRSYPHKNLHRVLDVWMRTQDCHLLGTQQRFWGPFCCYLVLVLFKEREAWKSSPEYFHQTFKIYRPFYHRALPRIVLWVSSEGEMLAGIALFVLSVCSIS